MYCPHLSSRPGSGQWRSVRSQQVVHGLWNNKCVPFHERMLQRGSGCVLNASFRCAAARCPVDPFAAVSIFAHSRSITQ